MTNQHAIGFLPVQFAVGLVGDLSAAQGLAFEQSPRLSRLAQDVKSRFNVDHKRRREGTSEGTKKPDAKDAL